MVRGRQILMPRGACSCASDSARPQFESAMAVALGKQKVSPVIIRLVTYD